MHHFPTATPRPAVPQLADSGGVRKPALPTWCANVDGRALIDAIIAEQPTRSSHYAMGFGVRQYNGKNAAHLRAMFDRALSDLIAWVDEARVSTLPGRPQPERYEQRRAAVAEWARVFSADALIQRVLGDAS